MNKFAEMLTHYSLDHFRDICAAMDMLCDEPGYIKVSFGKDLMKAQQRDDFTAAREIIDTQEQLLAGINMKVLFRRDYAVLHAHDGQETIELREDVTTENE